MPPKKDSVNPDQLLLQPTYDPRFFEDFIGRAILGDPKIALIELIANAWDAGATKVNVQLPDPFLKSCFFIEDNGAGMTASEFSDRWMTLSYNRQKNQGVFADRVPSNTSMKTRKAFGRNGKGRHAGFCFTRSEFYVQTKKNGLGITYKVTRPPGQEKPFECLKVGEFATDEHGVTIYSETVVDLDVLPSELRAEIGMRFLSFPEFEVTIDGVKVNFEDIPPDCFSSKHVYVKRLGSIEIIAIDTHASDRTTKHHGIAWHVSGRLVGEADWKNFGDQKFLDGRRVAAKRFSFIVRADCLDEPGYLAADWTGFNFKEPLVQKAYDEVNAYIRQFLLEQSFEEREKTFDSIREKNAPYLKQMGFLNAEIWSKFVNRIQEDCPSLSERELESVATILAKLEISKGRYDILHKLRECSSDDFDRLDELSNHWTIETAKIILDELQGRLQLIQQLESRILNPKTDELHDLQPIFDRALWIFGPEFESIEFTSNRTMASVISDLLKRKNVKGSARRPDYVALPDGTVGFYSRQAYDDTHEVDKVDSLAIVELKKPTVVLGRDERNQCEDYIVELKSKGQISSSTKVTCFLLGTTIKPFEDEEGRKGNMRLRPMTYETVIRRAKARTLYLFEKVKSAPFLKNVDLEEFLAPAIGLQLSFFDDGQTLDVSPPKAS